MLTTFVLALVLAQQPEPHRGWLHVAIGAHVLAQFADISTTEYALGTGRYREANPLMRGIANRPIRASLVKGGYAVGTSYLLLKLHRSHPRLAFGIAAGSAVFTGIVAAHNASLVRRTP